MELVEGATLAERIAQGPIPLEESIQITRQIASALDTAHSRGIVHRDLKSSNIKLTPSGVVKVLDFGLAKQGESEALRENSAHAPTAAALTQAGAIVGTAAAALTLVLVPLAFVHFRERPQAASQKRFQIPPGVTLAASGNIAVSPDGRKLAFLGIGSDGLVRIWLRDLSSLVVRPLQGSESAANAPPFFWSPDSRFIAFDAGGKLKKLNVSGGPAEVLVDLPRPIIGGSWNRHGDILMGTSSGILRVHEAGGPATAVTTLERRKTAICSQRSWRMAATSSTWVCLGPPLTTAAFTSAAWTWHPISKARRAFCRTLPA